jgi:hypothetical protein
VKKLNNYKLNPKIDFLSNVVKDSNIEEVFGPSYTSFRTTSPFFHPKSKIDLLKFYWQVFGMHHVINDEFNAWFIKGFIAQEKGEQVN